MSSSGQANGLAGILGANIRRAREGAGLTQQELANRLGGKTNGQRISDWERGYNRPNDTNLLLLAEKLERPFAWFYTDHDAVAA